MSGTKGKEAELLREIETLRVRVAQLELQAASAEGEGKYKALVDSVAEYLYSVEYRGGKQVFSYHSPQCVMITGYSPSDYLDDPDLWFKMIHPGDRQRVTDFFEEIKSDLARRNIEHRIIRKDGAVKWVSNHCSVVVDDKSGAIWMDGFLLDITELKDTEKERDRLFAAIEQSADTVVITDSEGVILYANPGFERITGYSRKEAIGKNPRILQSGRHDRDFYKELWGAIKNGKVWQGKFVNKKRDGSFYEELATISPVRDASGAIVNFVAVKRDVTKEAMLSKARDYFTAVTSHELRTPLIKIDLVRMLLEKLADAVTDKTALGKIGSALDNVYSSIETVVSATSLFSELSLAKTRESFIKTQIYMDLLGCVEGIRFSVKKENRAVTINADLTGLPKGTQAFCDQIMFTRAINEILSNAVKYTPDGKNIHVSAHKDNGRAFIEIRDDGIGIPEDMKDQVFDPYFSLENPIYYTSSKLKFKGGGIGLGLTVARMIMEFHDGSLTVKSEGEGKGSAVTLSLPILE
ncbi:MAG: PAS domain S-box protein [Nitrospinae bacterium]|nr:PAS domain S-box protein [Nitrospinota bacterium]